MRVVPAEAGVGLFAPTFTPDGSFVDFLRNETEQGRPAWRSCGGCRFSGAPKRLVENVWTAIGWSPDGRQMAFVRVDAAANSSALVIANADGSSERVLTTGAGPGRSFHCSPEVYLPYHLAGPPTVALSQCLEAGGPRTQIVFVDVASGSEVVRDSRGSFMPYGVTFLDATSTFEPAGRDRVTRATLANVVPGWSSVASHQRREQLSWRWSRCRSQQPGDLALRNEVRDLAG